MIKKLCILLLAIAPIAVFAQDKLAHINSQEILAGMPEMKNIEKELQTEREAKRKQVQNIEEEAQKLNENFQAKEATASATEKADYEKQILNIRERYQTFMQNAEKELAEKQEKLMGPVFKKIQDAIKAVGDAKGVTYVFDITTGNIIYHSSTSLDLTADVKTKLGIK